MDTFWYEIISEANLAQAHLKARQDKQHYHEVKAVDNNPELYLNLIQESLINRTYKIRPEDYTISVIHDKKKERELRKLSYYPHRIIQWAIMLQIQRVFVETFCPHSCASIPGRGGSAARELVTEYLKHDVKYCLKVDVTKFYANIDHTILKQQLRKLFHEQPLLDILDNIIESNPGGIGVPIGSYVSQFLANFYLDEFDKWLTEEKGEQHVVRYMDDVVVLHKSKRHLQKLLVDMEEYLAKLKLTLKANKQVFPIAERGIDFVGYRFFPDYTLLRKSTCKSFQKCCQRIQKKVISRKLLSRHEFCSINSYIGWLEYCDSYRLKQKYVKPVIPKLVEYYSHVIHQNTAEEMKHKKVNKYINQLIATINR